MGKRLRLYGMVIATAVVIAAAANVCAQEAPRSGAPAAGQTIDQRALDMLKKMSDTLTGARTVSFQARSMVPIMTPDGIWINLYGTSRVIMEGRGKLFASIGGDLAPHDFYFDGKTITAYAPDKNLYAVKQAPATIDAMIEQAYEKDGKTFPYADILLSDPYKVLTKGLVQAHYVGQSVVRPLNGAEGAETDHLVFSNEGVQWQIWIDAGDHLPRLVCATYLDNPGEPSYTVEFGSWKLNEPVTPETFIFNNVSQAAKVEFRNPLPGRRMQTTDTAVKK